MEQGQVILSHFLPSPPQPMSKGGHVDCLPCKKESAVILLSLSQVKTKGRALICPTETNVVLIAPKEIT